MQGLYMITNIPPNKRLCGVFWPTPADLHLLAIVERDRLQFNISPHPPLGRVKNESGSIDARHLTRGTGSVIWMTECAFLYFIYYVYFCPFHSSFFSERRKG
ncbi:hypothetical protein CDAR_37851 [Caerostris darwini]|uniref:Uncharacterized protein n=1 Tax=Caerostris darwini TaxID=1538125 RepID=A0AAV4T5Y2_9ARAC|nr:hypothetical protein CDAR_37851 [Caerostris darwini]